MGKIPETKKRLWWKNKKNKLKKIGVKETIRPEQSTITINKTINNQGINN